MGTDLVHFLIVRCTMTKWSISTGRLPCIFFFHFSESSIPCHTLYAKSSLQHEQLGIRHSTSDFFLAISSISHAVKLERHFV